MYLETSLPWLTKTSFKRVDMFINGSYNINI